MKTAAEFLAANGKTLPKRERKDVLKISLSHSGLNVHTRSISDKGVRTHRKMQAQLQTRL